MRSPISRFSAVAAAIALLNGCGADQPLTPEPGQESPRAGTAASPGAPSSLTVGALSPSQIALAWRDNSPNETGFEVHRSTSGPTGSFSLVVSTPSNVRSTNDAGLTPATEYCYKVRAFKAGGGKTTYSAFSNTTCTTTPSLPAAPSNTKATPLSSGAVTVTWSDNSENENGFQVQRSASESGEWRAATTASPNQTTFYHYDLPSEQQICYRVVAFNIYGSSAPSASDCTVPPAAPTNLTATLLETGGIQLSWEDQSGVEDGYQVQRGGIGVAFAPLADLPPNSTSYQDAEADPDIWHQYYVLATKDEGFSYGSNVASAGGCPPYETSCTNFVDDDCDGLNDDVDTDCVGSGCGYGCPAGSLCSPEDVCVSHCSDGARNGDEGDVDCGGSCGSKCDVGLHCYGNFDCASNFCVNSICQ